jgi:hypothetical protein
MPTMRILNPTATRQVEAARSCRLGRPIASVCCTINLRISTGWPRPYLRRYHRSCQSL